MALRSRLLGAAAREDPREFYQGIDWSKTKAYGLGINGLYVNQLGRERDGIVPPGPVKDELLREISAGLVEVVDPKTGLHPISKVFLRDEIYSGPHAALGPDAQIGYVRGYRASDECAVGEITDAIVADNTRRWSGDHCLDYRTVPGVLFTNFPVRRSEPALIDIAPTLLKFFGVPIPPEMTGQTVFQEAVGQIQDGLNVTSGKGEHFRKGRALQERARTHVRRKEDQAQQGAL